MKSAIVLGFTSSALATGTLGFALFKQAKPQLNSPFSRRDVFDTSVFTNYGNVYFLNISVGTPGQLQTVSLDTGSSDLFVTSSTAAYCQINSCEGGTFDMSKSSTAQMVAPDAFNITFWDGSMDSGDLVSDIVSIRDRVITNITMGLARNVKTRGEQSGLLGLGYSVKEASVGHNGTHYPNFVETLVNAGEIASRFYSLYLSNLGQFGSIIFGGVDTQKFDGDLVTLNCIPDDGDVYDFLLSMSEAKMTDENGTIIQLINRTNVQYGVFDSGATAWRVEDTVYHEIVDLTGFVFLPEVGFAIRPCVEVSNITAFDFQFRGYEGNNATHAHLRVLLSQMVFPLSTSEEAYNDPSGNVYCALAIRPSGTDSHSIWGDAIMRAGYFAFDLDNGQISLGQAKHSDQSRIVAVQAGPHGLASAINQPKYAQTAQTYSPAPFATDILRNASVSTANTTIGVAITSTTTEAGSSQFRLPLFLASVSWSTDSTNSNTTFSTSLIATSIASRTNSTVPSTVSSAPSAISGAARDTSIAIPNIAPSISPDILSNAPNASLSLDDSTYRVIPQVFL